MTRHLRVTELNLYLVNNVEDIIFFLPRKMFNSDKFSIFFKAEVLVHTDKVLKDTFVNRKGPLNIGESLEITQAVPFVGLWWKIYLVKF